MLSGLRIFVNNNLPFGATGLDGAATGLAASEYCVYFGHTRALTFASQLVESETLPNPKDFGKLFRSLNVYGYQTVVPKAFGQAIVTMS
jgi:hypothetical protein